jgi:hypothetical protein
MRQLLGNVEIFNQVHDIITTRNDKSIMNIGVASAYI